MSAFIVDKVHIDAVVTGLVRSEAAPPAEYGDQDRLGRALWAECLASVAYLYPGDKDGERPAHVDFRDGHVDAYVFTERRTDPGQLLKLAACLDYQSCEHPGWKTSDARRWVHALIDQLTAAGVTATGVWSLEDD